MKIGAIIGWYICTLFFESLTYGSAGYLIFKLLKGKDKYWLIGMFATFIVFILWNAYISNSIFRALEININNKVILDLVGGDTKNLFTTDFFDITIAFIQILVGFKLSQIIGRKFIKSN